MIKVLLISLIILNTVDLFAQKVAVKGFKKIYDGVHGFEKAEDSRLFGGLTCSIGDLDEDGINEVAMRGSFLDQGFVYIMFFDENGDVRKSTVIGRNLGGLTGDIPGSFDGFGWDLSPLDDLNNDGVADLAVSHYQDHSVFILFLNKNGEVQEFKRIKSGSHGFTQVLPNDTRFGASLALHDDLDNDGNRELLVGDTDSRGVDGTVYLLFLRDDGAVKSYKKIKRSEAWTTEEPRSDNNFGNSCTTVNDLNGDGISELIVAASFDSLEGSYYVIFHDKDFGVDSVNKYFPAALGLDANLTYASSLLAEIESLGDLDGNGIDDLAISAQFDSSGTKRTGSAFILFMNKAFELDTFLEITEGTPGFSNDLRDRGYFGRGLCSPGDLNGDGTRDLISTATQDDEAGRFAGAVYIIYLTGKTYVSKEQATQLPTLSIYPNPATTHFNIQSPSEAQYTITSITGAVVQQGQTANNKTIEVSTLPKGLYFITIYSGQHKEIQKLIVY